MEGHQLASIPESVEQIIMIGDHYQQMRMKPEIADYVRIFYKKGEYLDHHTTKNIPDALGFDKNAYFWNLDYTVEDDFHKSKINKLEIVNLLYLVRYLILQGYQPEQITILSMYRGQTILISKLIKKFEKILDKNENSNFFDIDISKILSNFEKDQDVYKELVLYQKCLKDDQLELQKKSQLEQEKEEKKQNERKKLYEGQENEEEQKNINDTQFNEDIKDFSDLDSDSDSQIVNDLNKIKVFTIDKYQGQENDIVLISLVRSNQKNSIGFLKEKSRVNVGLSRGKSGLYVLGNFSMIKAKQNEMWDSILNLAEQKQQFSKKLPLKCQRHGKIIEIQHTIDFNQVQNGGCDQICNQMLKCNHPCQELCHPGDHENIKCQIEVEFDCLECGQKSKSLCGQQQICQNKIRQQLKCEHHANIPCSQVNQVYECKQKCGKILKNCGHKCQQICHQNTQCDLNICQEKVEKKFICGHVIKNVTCSSQLTQINCPEPCDGKRFNCKHQCKGTCGSCVMSTMHVNCQVKQNMIDPFCNHETVYLCGLPLEKQILKLYVQCQNSLNFITRQIQMWKLQQTFVSGIQIIKKIQ
ncbi:P-loop containing nucleoside triphosphate hydrolase [Pseudocohnilembus persalinus]|uniref:p-loop containing nucleoside triphosphate hydrolase n=1 Tax=Pseudocohnilembus persalinus TaxID=266149 RepID=A0A0V0QFP4_PSEPJ|nr:P-loop containing nucleoside triphosphate hydrolase [Pseudocohnilembus persalinus]|eukprot:KRX01012.1 P-loop containing nucleoside triphosphate hydrolase [Pseudocohnilembus persalinus]